MPQGAEVDLGCTRKCRTQRLEPTNDLDAEPLDFLLVGFQGKLLVQSHDRVLFDEVVPSALVFEGDGLIGDSDGGHTDWQYEKDAGENAQKVRRPRVSASQRKFTNKEQRELEVRPARIEAFEKQQTGIAAKLADTAFYRN